MKLHSSRLCLLATCSLAATWSLYLSAEGGAAGVGTADGVNGAGPLGQSEEGRGSSGEPPGIPRQFIMMHKYETVDQLPSGLQENIRRVREMSPEMQFRWFGDGACREYIERYYDAELAGFYVGEAEGSFRGDICRAAVLLREGGFYVDTDLQLAVPLRELVDSTTTFMSVWCDAGVLNALIASSRGNEVIRESLRAIRRWYRQPAEDRRGIMGPRTYAMGLQAVVETHCSNQTYKIWNHGEPSRSKYMMEFGHLLRTGEVRPLLTRTALAQERTELQWSCGPNVIRMYLEKGLSCDAVAPSMECPEDRAKLYARTRFEGMRVGLFEPFLPGGERRLIGWPRSVTCKVWGCGLARTPPPMG